MLYKHILITTDLLKGSDISTKRAVTLAKQFSAKLTLLYVLEPVPAYGFPGITLIDMEEKIIEELQKELNQFAKHYAIAEKDVHLVRGSTKTEIHDFVEKNKIDLVVIGTRVRHGLGFLLGSTANAVIHSVNCDVLTVRIAE